MPTTDSPAVDSLDVRALTVPTEEPESDGTLTWDKTTIVVVHVRAGGRVGLGYSYTDTAAVQLIRGALAPVVVGSGAFAVPQVWNEMVAAVRNIGRRGLAGSAIAAVDSALWDLKARLFDVPLVELLGRVRDTVPIYGSGGFTSYSVERLTEQFTRWSEAGVSRLKMKVGRNPDADVRRVSAAREAVGPSAALYVDANGAYDRKQALDFAFAFHDAGVTWFEEPVTSDDLDGLRLLRDRAPAAMEITAGEYGYDIFDFRRMLDAGAVDVLMADATRCGGITGFLRAAALCESFAMPLSSHTAPALHLHACAAATPVRHMEWFHDHVRVEHELFEGAVTPVEGALEPDRSRAGMGLELRSDADRYAAEAGRQG